MNASLREYYPFSRLVNLSDSGSEKIADFTSLGGKERKCLTVLILLTSRSVTT